MSSYHKPKVFRSVDGCCICKAKSSSSRFTDSGKYEDAFNLCFKIDDTRFGEICNACVLIVKRWRNLPRDTKKNWNHVVDSRVGPGGSKVTFRNVKKKPEPAAPVVMVEEKFEKIRKKKEKMAARRYVEAEKHSSQEDDTPGFISLSYFRRRSVCCGVIYEGLAGEIVIDQKYFKRCQYHSNQSSSSMSSSTSAEVKDKVAEDKSVVIAGKLFEESDDNVDDTDSISFYSDESECGLSKISKDDIPVIHDTDGDEGFYDKSELKKALTT